MKIFLSKSDKAAIVESGIKTPEGWNDEVVSFSGDLKTLLEQPNAILLRVYNALTGESVKKFADRKSAIARVKKVCEKSPTKKAEQFNGIKPIPQIAAKPAAKKPVGSVMPAPKGKLPPAKKLPPKAAKKAEKKPGSKGTRLGKTNPMSKVSKLRDCLEFGRAVKVEEVLRQTGFNRTNLFVAIAILKNPARTLEPYVIEYDRKTSTLQRKVEK